MDAADGYVGLQARDRWMSAGGVVMVFAILLLAAMLMTRLPARVTAPWEATLRTFDVPPPPVVIPPVPPPPAQMAASTPAPVEKAKAPARGGGSPGIMRARPAEVTISPAPPIVAAPPTPLIMVDAPPPSAGRSMGTATGGAGGVGTGTGAGQGDGSGAGSSTGTGEGGGGTPRYARTEWITPPTRDDFQREWPRYAPRLTTTVHVLLACRVVSPGFLRRCVVLRDGQPGEGYGKAAIRVVRASRVRPVRKDGRAVDMPVLVPLAFEPAARPARSVPVASSPS